MERTVLFHRTFPDKFIKLWRLREVYRQNLIKIKAINMAKMPIKGRDGRYEPLRLEMLDRMESAIARNRKIVWLDETMFTKQTNLKLEWSKRKTNFITPCEAFGQKYTAVLAAISEGYGFEHVQLYDSAVEEQGFMVFLRRL